MLPKGRTALYTNPSRITLNGFFCINVPILYYALSPNQCFLNAIVQCLSHTRGLRDYCLLKLHRQEKFIKEEAKLTEGMLLSPAPPSSSCHPSVVIATCYPVPAFSQVLLGLWDENEGDTAINPRQFYNLFKEAVPYFSGYR